MALPPPQASSSWGGGLRLEDLLPGLLADDLLKLPADQRKQVRAVDRAQDVVRVADVGHPVAGPVDRVFMVWNRKRQD